MQEYDHPTQAQFAFLCLYVRKPEKVAEFIRPQYFSNLYHLDIARVVAENREKHPHDQIDKATLRALIKNGVTPKHWNEAKQEFQQITHDLYAYRLDSTDTTVELIRDWARQQEFRGALVQAENDINTKDFAGAIRRFERLRDRFTPQTRVFHSYSDFRNAPELSFAIAGFLQNGAATLIGGPSGHGKTWIMLSMVKALLTGKPLWGHFKVPRKSHHVAYLIPESGIAPFKSRLLRMHLMPYVKNHSLLVHTLSAGPKPALDDPRVLAVAKRAHFFLDTAIRFSEGNENEASDNQQGLASDIFALLSAGARSVTGAHHSPKAFAKGDTMTLENVLRGTSDIGAMVATVWGVKQIEAERNILHIENVKPRDFEPCRPFQIIGRPYIDRKGDFQMYKTPGTCGSLRDEQPKPGASVEARNARRQNIDLLRGWLKEDPNQSSKALVRRFRQEGIELSQSAVRRYRSEINKQAVTRMRNDA